MRPWMRWVLGGLIAIALTALVAIIAVRRQVSVSAVQKRLVAWLGPPADSLYRVSVGSSTLSLLSGTYVATDISIEPDSAAFTRRRVAKAAVQTRYSFHAGSVRLTGIDIIGLLLHRIVMNSAQVDSMDLDIYLDRTVPKVWEDTIRSLPHQVLMGLRRRLRVDTISLLGRMRYAERAEDGARPGAMRFEDLTVAITNLTNDPVRAARTPVQVDLGTMLAGAGRTHVVFEYDVLSPKLTLSYRGGVGPMPGKALNEALVNLEGMRIVEGRHDSTWFDIKVKDDVATGPMLLLYHDLQTEYLDKATRKQSFSDELQSFLATTFGIHSDNGWKADSPTKPYPIHLTRSARIPIFQFVWYTIRQGLLGTIKKGERKKVGI